MFPDVLEELRVTLRREVDALKTELALGRAVDYPAYREMVGKIKANELILDEIKAIEEKYLEE